MNAQGEVAGDYGASPGGRIPMHLIEKIYGQDAINFLREKERIESLKPDDPEYRERKKYFQECREIAEKIKGGD